MICPSSDESNYLDAMANAYVHIYLETGEVRRAANEIADSDAVAAAHVVTGEYDIIAQLDLDDPDALPDVVVDDVHSVDGVIDTVTSVAFEP